MKPVPKSPRKLPGITEKEFQAQIVKAAKLLGWHVYHTYDSRRSQPGFPDLVLVKDRIIFAEVKVGKNKLSEFQIYWMDKLAAAGHTMLVWRPEKWDSIEMELKSAKE